MEQLVLYDYSKIVPSKKPHSCPSCGQLVKLYKRKIYSAISRRLITLYQLSKESDFKSYHNIKEIYLVSDRFGKINTVTGDFPYAKMFGLIESLEPNLDKTKKTTGCWRLTEKGILFVEGKVSVPKYVLVFNAKIYGYEGPRVYIKDCLGEQFNYQELMRG